MESIFIILIAILATAGVYSITKGINGRVEIFRDQARLKRNRIANIGRLWNRVNITDKRLASAEDTLLKTSKLANNFDRDMDRYHANIGKEIDRLTNRLVNVEELNFNTKVDKLKNALGLAFKRITKLEFLDPRTFESPYAERMTAIERRQKEVDTSLFAHAEIIEDLRNQFKKPAKAATK